MKNDYYFITKAAFDEFVAQLKNEYAVFLPERKEPSARPEPDYSYTNAPGASFTFNPYRTIEPLKAFFTHCYEKVSDYFLEGKNVTDVAEETVIFGVKGCDIAGHAIQDFVFLEGRKAIPCTRCAETPPFLSSAIARSLKRSVIAWHGGSCRIRRKVLTSPWRR
jgi:hypothetical protein